MAEIQGKIDEQAGRNAISRILHAKNVKEMVVTWRMDLNRILDVFNVGFVCYYLDIANRLPLDRTGD